MKEISLNTLECENIINVSNLNKGVYIVKLKNTLDYIDNKKVSKFL